MLCESKFTSLTQIPVLESMFLFLVLPKNQCFTTLNVDRPNFNFSFGSLRNGISESDGHPSYRCQCFIFSSYSPYFEPNNFLNEMLPYIFGKLLHVHFKAEDSG